INSAKRRLWIATPYFVPDEGIINALKLAALRGVDVRIILPRKNDLWLVQLAAYSYLVEFHNANIQFFWYRPGFMHQKVMLIDDSTSVVGTANLDNRSMKLNFEITALVLDKTFAGEMEEMLVKDFESSIQARRLDHDQKGFIFRISVRVARLLSPIL
ncbi:cardiolipin synthase, partial [Candidatus Sumerlaeota bacterium]|nr:cardiolipin synthase [Candidatus Sumerlaeota bacterium]